MFSHCFLLKVAGRFLANDCKSSSILSQKSRWRRIGSTIRSQTKPNTTNSKMEPPNKLNRPMVFRLRKSRKRTCLGLDQLPQTQPDAITVDIPCGFHLGECHRGPCTL